MNPPPPRRRPSVLSVLVSAVVIVWAIEALASTFDQAPSPDNALTLAISGLVGAFAGIAVRMRDGD